MKTFRLLLTTLLLLLCSSAAWADQKTATWNATNYSRSTDITKLSSNDITVTLTNICTSSERTDSKRNFQCKDGTQASFTVTAPDGYLVRSIRIYDDFKDGRDLTSKNSDYGVNTDSDNECKVSIGSNKRESKSVTVDCYKGGDGTNFRYLEVVCVKDVSISFGQSTYYIYANGGDYSPSLNLNGHDGTVEYKSGDSKIGKYADGKVTPVKAGTIIINATCKGSDNYARSNEAATTIYVIRDKMSFKWDENYGNTLLTNEVDQSTSIKTLSMTISSLSGKWTSNSGFSVSSSDNTVLTATLSGNKIYLYHKGKDGEATITVTQAQTDIYEKTTGSITFNVIQTDQNGEKNVTIGSLDDWNSFVSLVKSLPVPVNAKLTADVDLGTTFNQAKAKGGYTGVFDGNNRSLTFNWSSTDGTPALFYKVKSATFKNLTINGSASGLYASGLAYSVTDTCTVLNCVSNVAATASSWQLSSGFFVWISGGATIEDCVDNSTGGGMAFLTELGDKSYINLINCLYTGPANTKFPNQTFSDPNFKVINSYTLNHAGYKNLPKVTEDQMKSGEIAHKLQNGRATQVWGQTLGTDAFPHLSTTTSQKVCKVDFTYSGQTETNYVNLGQTVTTPPTTKDVAGTSYNPSYYYTLSYSGGYTPSTAITADRAVTVTVNKQDYIPIASAADWKTFCSLVNGGQPELNAKLTADITLNDIVMAGDDAHRYSGIFNGNNHIITLNWTHNGNAALFGALSGALIGDLAVAGTNHGGKRIGGFAVDTHGDVTFIRCKSAVDISTTDKFCSAGFVANIVDGSISFASCLGASNGAYGFFGSHESSGVTINLTDCLYLGSNNYERYGTYKLNILNSYQLNRSGYKLTNVTEEQLKSGEITYLLNGSKTGEDNAWVQNLDNGETVDGTPMLKVFAKDHGLVYHGSTYCDGTDALYSNATEFPAPMHVGDNYNENGLCANGCGAYQPAPLVDGVYQISNAGQLAWFRDYVNTANADPYKHASAKLMKDIDLSTVCYEGKNWVPIGKYSPYKYNDPWYGNFEGDNHRITGLYIYNDENTKENNQAFIGYGGGKIQNLYLDGNVKIFDSSAAILISYENTAGEITNCHVSGTLAGIQYIASIAAYADGRISKCTSSVKIDTKDSGYCVGGIAAFVFRGATITECVFTGEINSTAVVSKYNTPTIGGIVGIIAGHSTLSNCVNNSTMKVIDGEVGAIAGDVLQATLSNNLNLTTSMTSDYTHQAIVGSSDQGTYSNNYYLETDKLTGDNGTAVTAAQLASGEVAYLLNGSTTNTDNLWVQNLDNGQTVDATPVLKAFAKEHGLVYQVDAGYTNIDPNPVLPGDANGDGTVTITDALAVVYHVLNKTVENFNEAAADMDGSGDISITDALAIVKAVLGSSASAKQVNDVIEDMLDPQ